MAFFHWSNLFFNPHQHSFRTLEVLNCYSAEIVPKTFSDVILLRITYSIKRSLKEITFFSPCTPICMSQPTQTHACLITRSPRTFVETISCLELESEGKQ